MKAIAFAIICAAYLLLPSAEVEKLSYNWLVVNGVVFIVCIIGFWVNIFTEK